MSILSDTALAVLQDAGWHEGRSITTEKNMALLSDAGCPVFNELETFLTAFGDLDLRYTNSMNMQVFISFDIAWSLSKAVIPQIYGQLKQIPMPDWWGE